MKKIFYIIALVFLFIGCSAPKPHMQEIKDDEFRFQIIYTQHLYGGYATIIVDKETHVKYLFIKEGYGAGLIKLEEANNEKDSFYSIY